MDLDDVQRRLERLFAKGEDPGPFVRLWGLSQEPARVKADALAELFKALRLEDSPNVTLRLHFTAACQELSSNVEIIEGLAATREHPPFAYVTWLWRVTETLRSMAQELAGVRKAADVARPTEQQRPPLASQPLPPLPPGRRLQGFAVEPLLELAKRETSVLGRRRRLLEAARRALLESAAAVQIPAELVEPRMLAITQGIQEVTEWQQAGIDADEAVPHQLRRAVQARDAQTVEALLRIMASMSRSLPQRSGLSARIELVRTTFSRRLGHTALPSLEAASVRVFGQLAADAVLRSSARALRELNAAPNTASEMVQAANCVDACFELGRSVSPVRVLEEQRRMAVVPFPTQTMVLEPARRVADLSHSLISDPRLVLYQLATRSLLSRRYLADRQQRSSVVTRYAEARYYLLDGSASMSGRRGRLRDAILVSELATMIRHLESGTATARPIVYYRYFTKHAETAVKVETVDEALTAIDAIITRKSRGETDIQSALIDSFHQIDKERLRDPNLQRAQLVLVTDGIAEVDLSWVWRARQSLKGMPVYVSVIALGGESPALKELAATQRAQGEPVFYHYLSDRAMHELLGRTRIARPPLHFPPRPAEGPELEQQAAAERTPSLPEPLLAAATTTSAEPFHVPIVVELELWQQLDELVDELSVLHQPPDVDALEQAGLLELAFEELGVSLSESGFEAQRAQAEASKRDARAVGLRFDRWFPDLDSQPTTAQAAPPAELLEVIEIVLLTVSELTDYLSGSPLGRCVDAIEILERLLLEAGVSPWAYSQALSHASARSREALRVLRRLAGRAGSFA